MAEAPPELAAEIRKLERKHEENPAGRYFVPLANAYRKAEDLPRAETLLREGLRNYPDYLSAHIVLGRCYADRGATAEAIREFRHVLTIDPQNLIALRTLGELAAAEGRREDASRWFTELLAVDPMNADARQMLGSLDQLPPAAALQGDSDGAAAEAAEPVFVEQVPWWERPAHAAPQAQSEALTPQPDTDAEPTDTASHAGWVGSEVPGWVEIDLPPDATGPESDSGDSDALQGAPGAEPLPSLREPGANAAESAAEPSHLADVEPSAVADATAKSQPNRELECPTSDAGAGADAESGGEEGEPADDAELVTATIAELYARQGFPGRAAEVYRELIRRGNGDTARLQQRLSDLQETDVPQPDADSGAPDADAFAESFADGFGGSEAEAEWLAARAPESDAVAAEPEWPAETEWPAEPEWPVEPAPSPRSVQQFFAELLAWEPAGRVKENSDSAAHEPAWVDDAPGENRFPWELPLSVATPAAPENEAVQSSDDAEAAEGGGSDADLESFQEWLRSLKR